jgi:hypothetical protein
MTREITVVAKIPIRAAESTVANKIILVEVAFALTSQIAEHKIIIDKPAITVADALAQHNIAHPIRARSATVPAAASGVVAVYKLATLIVPPAKYSAPAIASPAALTQRCGRNDHGQKQSR